MPPRRDDHQRRAFVRLLTRSAHFHQSLRFSFSSFLSNSPEAFEPPVVFECESGACAIQVPKVLSRCCRHALEESEQLSIDLILESRTHAVRCAWNDFQHGALDDFRRDQACNADGYDLVVVAMQDKSWYIEPRQVFCEISLGKGFNALVDGFVPSEHRLEPKGIARSEERRVGKECRSRWWPYH